MFKKVSDGKKGLEQIKGTMEDFNRMATNLHSGAKLVASQTSANKAEILKLQTENTKLVEAGAQASTLATNLKAMTAGKLLVEASDPDVEGQDTAG